MTSFQVTHLDACKHSNQHTGQPYLSLEQTPSSHATASYSPLWNSTSVRQHFSYSPTTDMKPEILDALTTQTMRPEAAMKQDTRKDLKSYNNCLPIEKEVGGI